MRHSIRALIAILCTPVAAPILAAHAQGAPQVTPGTRVRTTDRTLPACLAVGVAVSTSSDSVVVESPLPSAIDPQSARCARVERRTVPLSALEVFGGYDTRVLRGAGRGAISGALAGLGIGFLAGADHPIGWQLSRPESAVLGGGLGIILGTVLGGIIGSFMGGEKWVAAAATRTSTLLIEPGAAGDRVRLGVRISR